MDSSGARSPATCAFASNIPGYVIHQRRSMPISFQPEIKEYNLSYSMTRFGNGQVPGMEQLYRSPNGDT
jgi:hypothetical protein